MSSDARMQTAVVVIHGAGTQENGRGSGSLVSHLRGALEASHVVVSPAMPAPGNPTYRAWKAALDRVLQSVDGPFVLVGHSLGGSVLLKYLAEERPAPPVRALFLVAAPYWGSTDWESDEFVLRPGFADSLPPNAAVFLYHSRDDDVVPSAHAERYGAEIPRAVLRLVDGRGHEFRGGLPELVADLAAGEASY